MFTKHPPNPNGGRTAWLARWALFGVAAAGLFATDHKSKGAANADPTIVKEFQQRISDYMKLRSDVQRGLPAQKQTDNAAEIVARQRLLAERIREKRAGVSQGNIFSPEISAEFIRVARQTMQGDGAKRIKKSLKGAEPVRVALKVNDSYPAEAPLQSTPPSLLLSLPLLPKELEYRVNGHALALRDLAANLIVDLIPEAIP
jgi:hypothetical protein